MKTRKIRKGKRMEAPLGHSMLSTEVWKQIFAHLPMLWRAMCCRVCKIWQKDLEQPQQGQGDDILVDYGLATLCSMLATKGADEVMRRIRLHYPAGIAPDLGRIDQARRFVLRHGSERIESVDEWMQLASQEPDAGWLCKVAYKTGLGERRKSLMRQVVGKPQDFSNVLHTLRHLDKVLFVVYSPDGKRIASASSDKTAKVWDAVTMEEVCTLSGHTGDNPECKCKHQYDNGWEIRSCDFRVNPKCPVEGHSGKVLSVAWSPDGEMIASGSGDKTVRLWSKSGELKGTLTGHSCSVWSVAWNHDGSQLASGSSDCTVRLWTPDGKEKGTLRGDCVSWLHMDPGSKALAANVNKGGSAGSDRTGWYIVTANENMVYVYRTELDGGEQGEPLACFRSPSKVLSVSCKGTSIVVGGKCRQVRRDLLCGANAAVFLSRCSAEFAFEFLWSTSART